MFFSEELPRRLKAFGEMSSSSAPTDFGVILQPNPNKQNRIIVGGSGVIFSLSFISKDGCIDFSEFYGKMGDIPYFMREVSSGEIVEFEMYIEEYFFDTIRERFPDAEYRFFGESPLRRISFILNDGTLQKVSLWSGVHGDLSHSFLLKLLSGEGNDRINLPNVFWSTWKEGNVFFRVFKKDGIPSILCQSDWEIVSEIELPVNGDRHSGSLKKLMNKLK
jgi:hypothetical protein